MKSEFDTEMDALLRGRARRDDAWRATGGGRDPLRDALAGASAAERGAHLDADELAAFAEHALPDASRARYAAHLADCDECRRVATQVALAAGVAVAREERAPVAVQPSVASWRERVAALFAPRVWRYAMPVVALLGVGVVALILLKSVPRPGAADMAQQNMEPASAGANGVAKQDENHATTVAGQPAPQTPATEVSTTREAASDSRNAQAAAETRNVPAATDDPKQAQAGSDVANAVAGAGAQSVPAQRQQQPIEQQQYVPPPATSAAPTQMAMPTPVPTPMPVPPPVSDADEVKVAKEAPKDKTAESEDRAGTRASRRAGERGTGSGGSGATEERTANRTALRPEPATETPGAKAEAKRARQKSEAARDEEKKSDAALAKPSVETRSAGGRKFRREGNAWIDTAYNSSQATANVRRNSEQYRALVADEPEIGRIADALGGEVVVVWKGRAYRIKP
ncbi:MAG: zf-HC2 domain-containing protein [Pyrinomonadaceae bacterium]